MSMGTTFEGDKANMDFSIMDPAAFSIDDSYRPTPQGEGSTIPVERSMASDCLAYLGQAGIEELAAAEGAQA